MRKLKNRRYISNKAQSKKTTKSYESARYPNSKIAFQRFGNGIFKIFQIAFDQLFVKISSLKFLNFSPTQSLSF